MSLKVKFVNGPNAGSELTFGDDKQEIRFGRSVGSDVTFSEDLTVVSREHFGLRKEYGGYKFIINPEKPVFMNGTALYDDQSLPKDAEIALGTPQGPRLKLERVEGYGSNQAKTEVLKPQREVAQDLRTTQARGNRTLGIVLGSVAAIAILGVAGYFIAQSLRSDVSQVQGDVANVQQQMTQVASDMPAVREKLAALASSNFDMSAVVAKNKASVYQVELKLATGEMESSATASVVQLPDGTKALATNGHVAEMYDDLMNNPRYKGGRLVAVESKAPDYPEAEITGVKVHPGFNQFARWAAGMGNIAAARGAAQNLKFMLAYDVSLLFVKEPDKLGPPLTFASEAEIEGLKTGDPLVLIGFPAEGLAGTDAAHPDPTSQTGRIVSLTTFFLQTGDASNNYLVQHSIPTAGGASGSPIFNTKGDVVAFHNAGNHVGKGENGERLSSAALVNYAQRADLMLHLMQDKADDDITKLTAAEKAEEQELLLTLDQQMARITALIGRVAGSPGAVEFIGDFEGAMDQNMPNIGSPRNYVATFDIAGDGNYWFVARSDDGRPVRTVVLAPGNKPFMADGIAQISYLNLNIPSGAKIDAVAVDFNAALGENALPNAGRVTISVYKTPMIKD